MTTKTTPTRTSKKTSSNETVVTIRVPDDLLALIDKIAEREFRSRAGTIIKFLTLYTREHAEELE